MTEQERSFEAWRSAQGGPTDWESGISLSDLRRAFLAGWARERVKAKPLVMEGEVCGQRVQVIEIEEWVRKYSIPMYARIKVTCEEV